MDDGLRFFFFLGWMGGFPARTVLMRFGIGIFWVFFYSGSDGDNGKGYDGCMDLGFGWLD